MHLNPLDPFYNGANNHIGRITFNRSICQQIGGTVVLKVMDPDLTGTSATVKVKSTSDPAGINFTLTGNDGIYTGTLHFTNSSSVPNRYIQVANSNTITVSYYDATPNAVRSASSLFITNAAIITNYFWIWSEPHIPTDFTYDETGSSRTTNGGYLGAWNPLLCVIGADDTVDFPPEETKSMVLTYSGNSSIYWIFSQPNKGADASVDLSSYKPNGYLHFWIKTSINIGVKLEDSDSLPVVIIPLYPTYIAANGEWEKVSIKLSSTFSALNWTAIKVPMGVLYGGTNGIVKISGVYLTDK